MKVFRKNLPVFIQANSPVTHSSPPPLSPSQMRSVDRVFKFIDLPSEEPLPEKLGGKGRPDLVIDNPHAQDCWPNRGQMDVQGLSVKYTEAGRAVLGNVSFSVDGGLSVSLEWWVKGASDWLMRFGRVMCVSSVLLDLIGITDRP